MPCFMAEDIHTRKGTQRSTDNGKTYQRDFGDPPAVLDGQLLIPMHKQKRNHIYYNQVNKKRHHINTFLGGNFVKRLWILLLCVFLLTGCGAKETFETVDDLYLTPASASMKQVSLALPKEAAISVMDNGEGGRLYLCDGYVLTVQTMESGDLEKTLLETTGFSKNDLTLMETDHYGTTRYDCVWTSAGETGDQVCRAAILDDGTCHYVVTVMAPAENAGGLRQTWQNLLDSISLISTDPEHLDTAFYTDQQLLEDTGS